MRRGLRALAAAAREHDLGLVVDVVPNHMALVAPESATPRCGTCCATAATPPTRTGSTSTGSPAAAGSACRCCGSRSPRRSRPGDLVLDELDGQPVHPLLRARLPGRARHRGRRRRRGAGPPALPAGQLARARRDAQLPPLLRGRLADRRPGRAARRLRGHPPGAARPQPRRHHRRLPHRPPRRPGRPRGLPQPAARGHPPRHAIWVEKILEGDERLPAWACDGTTGYDAMQAVRRARRPGHRAGPDRTPGRQAGGAARRRARPSTRPSGRSIDESLGPEVGGCIRRAREALPDPDPERLREAVVELLVACEVYRAYVRPDERLSAAGAQADRGRVRRRGGGPARPRARARAAGAPGAGRGRATRPPWTSRSACSRPGDR